MGRQLRIAVIGSGISGLAAAWLLSKRHRVTLFETNRYFGGHSNTVEAPGPSVPIPVDTGFIVYNDRTYPNLVALFEHLSVPTAPSSMSFAVSLDDGAYEYSGSGVTGLFGQRRNILRPSHYRMTADILRFFRESPRILDDPSIADASLGSYIASNGYSSAFVHRHILPMAAAIWSTPSARVLDYPVASFVRFFQNHGLLQATNQPTWRTVRGGSREYVRRILADFSGDQRLAAGVTRIERSDTGVDILAGSERQTFDSCVIATHADDALALLAEPTAAERETLGAFSYTANRAILHRDPAQMPKRRRVWSSWNYLGSAAGGERDLSLTYWMNNLQPLGVGAGDIFVTLNPRRTIDPRTIVYAVDYNHPVFDARATRAQGALWSLQGRHRTWFCGSYFGYGFHEDGLQAGLAVAEQLGGTKRPWSLENASSRIHVEPVTGAGVSGLAEAAE
jgi:predicted NAD/FAD-binding protein